MVHHFEVILEKVQNSDKQKQWMQDMVTFPFNFCLTKWYFEAHFLV